MRDIVAVDHDWRQRKAWGGGKVERVQPFDKARRTIRLMGLHHLHHKLASAQALARFLTCAQPGWTVVAAATRVRAHVRRAAEASDAALGGRRAVALRVDLQRAANEEVAGILSRDLCERAVGPQMAIGADREYIGVVRNVAFHSQLRAEAIDAVDEAGFDRGGQGREPVQSEMAGGTVLPSD